MKKSSVVLTTFFLGVASVAFAQTQTPARPPAAPPVLPTKIGTVNMGQAIGSTKEGQKATADIATKFGPRKAEADKRRQDIDAQTDQLNKGAATMSDAAKQKMQMEIQNKEKDYKRFIEDAQTEVETEDAKVSNTLQNKMQTVIQQFSIQNGYAVVLDYGNQGSPVVWKATITDITEDLVKLYDTMYPVKVTAPAPPPAKK